MNSNVSATRSDEFLEGSFLCFVENVSDGKQEDDSVELSQVCVGEYRGILGGYDGEAMLSSEFANCIDGSWNGVVSKSGGLRED